MKLTSNLNSTLLTLSSYGLCLFIVSYFLYPLNSSPKAIFYLFIVPPLLVYALFNIKNSNLQIVFGDGSYFYLRLGLFAIVIYIWCSYLWGTPGDFEPFLSKSKRVAEIVVLLFAIYILVYNRASLIKTLMTAAFVAAAIHACLLIPEHLPAYLSAADYRITNPIDTGIVYGIALTIGMWRFLAEESKVSLFYLVASFPLIVILVMTKSRGPQLALILTMLPIIFIHKHNWQRILATALGIGVLIVILAIWTDAFQLVFSRGFDLNHRDQIWAESIRQFLEYPIFGSGAHLSMPIPIGDGFVFSHSHNILLDVLRATGIIGFALVTTHNFYALWKGITSKNREIMLWSIIFLFSYLCLMSNGEIPLVRPSHLWMAYWIPLGFICFMLAKQNIQENKIQG